MEITINSVIPPGINTAFLSGWNRFLGRNENLAALIRIDLDLANLNSPYTVCWTDLVENIKKNFLIILNSDKVNSPNTPKSKTLRSLESLGAGEMKRYQEHLTMMMPIISKRELLFNSNERWELLKEAAKRNNLHPLTVRRLYYRYFYFGCDTRAFVPDYTKRGGPQKRSDAFRGRTPGKPKERRRCSLKMSNQFL